MNPITYAAFTDELQKLAALSDAERSELKRAIRAQAKFEGQAAAGTLDDAGQAAMRANTERIKAYTAKSRGQSASIPDWAANPDGSPPPRKPPHSPHGGARREGKWEDIYDRAYARYTAAPVFSTRRALAGALGFGALGSLVGAFQGATAAGRRELQRDAAHGGDYAKFMSKYPALGAGLPSAVAGAGFGFRDARWHLATLLAGGLGPAAIDFATKDRSKKKAA